MNELLVLGISHRTAPVAVRERLALTERQVPGLLQELVATDHILEAAVVQTCNRSEVYLVTADAVRAESHVLSVIADAARMRATQLAGLVYTPRNCDVARHLYRVVSGLDSMILGEYEIQGQVKRAYELALRAGTTGPMLNRLFRAALETGKRVRSETRIAERRTSVASVAVEVAASTVGDLSDRRVVVVGAGETSELTAQALAAQGVRTIFVSNRHADRARGLATRFGGQVGSLDDLPFQIAEADIVVSSTGSPHAILEAEELGLVMGARPDRPLCVIDIAVPRDVDPECALVPGVTLYDIDDLQGAVARNLAGRSGESEAAEAIVEDEIQRFARWLGQLDVTPTIADLRGRADEITARVLAENRGRWRSADEVDLERVEQVARTVVKRLLHEPTVRLKRSRDQDAAHRHVETLRELFALDEATTVEARQTDALPTSVVAAHAVGGGAVSTSAPGGGAHGPSVPAPTGPPSDAHGVLGSTGVEERPASSSGDAAAAGCPVAHDNVRPLADRRARRS